MTIKECAEILREQDRFLIVTHVRPDGDTLGCASALCHTLRLMGKTAYMYVNPEITETHYDFVSPYFADDDYEYDFAVSVDMASRGMDPVGFDKTVHLCIDHHDSNSYYAERSLVMAEYAACGEILALIINELRGEIDPVSAELLYIAVSSDTGCFCYGSTTAHTLKIASELVEAGADNARLNKYFFRTVSPARIRLEGEIYRSLEFFDEGRIAVSRITLEMMKNAGAGEADCEDIASLPGKIKGVFVGITVRQLSEALCKISVRTMRDISANVICEQFGGGGHPAAAGCTMLCGVDEAVRLVTEASVAELAGKWR